MATRLCIRRAGALSALAFVLCFGSTAASAGDFSRLGVYLGVGGTYATDLYEDEIEDSLNGVKANVDPTGGVNARLGVRFLKVLALEAQYEWLSPYDVSLRVSGFGKLGTVEVEQHTLTGNLKLYLPIWRIQPYALAGIGLQRIDLNASGGLGGISDTETALAGRAGAGVEIYLSEHVVLYGEGAVVLTDEKLNVPSALGKDIDHIFYAAGQAGLMWRF